ncbi:glycoside hydrolase family 97 protein [Hoylesella nanceiensis]
MMNKNKITLLLCICAMSLSYLSAFATSKVTSPNGRLSLLTGVDASGKPYFELLRDNKSIIKKSYLGVSLKDGQLFEDFKVTKTSRNQLDETWQQPLGEELNIRNHYNELTLHLQQKKDKKRMMNIVFRLFNDGMGFRYVFPKQANLNQFTIIDEKTALTLPWDAPAWTIPTEGTHYYEALWTKAPIGSKPTVSTPITMEVNDSLYLVFHEANLTDYATLNYHPQKDQNGQVILSSELTPWSNGDKVYAATPFVSPWRTVIVGSTIADITASRLMLNLNEPCKIKDTSWIEDGKYVGIWWAIHMGDYTWSQGEKHGATTANTKRYIDFAAKNGFKGVLVEGWNWGWDGNWGAEGDKFNFTKAYPDYDLDSLQHYALSKGVRLIAHNETGGSAKNYEQQLDSAFALYQRLGIRTVKTGYVNDKMDNLELQHSQYGVRHYRKVIETAAKYQIMIVNHEPAMPTGLNRTYPNLISGEGVRGQEYNAWSQDGGNPPYHLCIVPFTRQLAGAIDYTPGIFNFENKAVPQSHPQTTIAKQLASYVVIYSPWQMAADKIENYEAHPALSFIQRVPTNWQESRVLNAELGKYVTIARKERNGNNWYIGGLTDQDPRTLILHFDFLDNDAQYEALIYSDGEGADYRTNPYPLAINQKRIRKGDSLQLKLAPSGGFAIELKKIN